MTIEVSKFCEEETGSRWGVPWIHNGKTYATDGRIAIRLNAAVPEYSEFEDRIGKRKPNIDEILKPMESITEWFSPPMVTKCDRCQNQYKLVSTCDNCRGAGLCICGCCEDEHGCNWCDGDGEIEDRCYCHTSFSNRKIMNLYAEKISKLPNVHVGVLDDGFDRPVFFTFHGGVGVVMPISGGEK